MSNSMKKITSIVLLLLAILTVSVTANEEESHENKANSAPQSVADIMGALSAFASKPILEKESDEKNAQESKKLTEDKKTTVKKVAITDAPNIVDLKDAIKTIETKKDRENLLKVMKALAGVNAEAEKKQNLIEKVNSFISSAIEASATVILNLIVLVGNLPNDFIDDFRQLGDPNYRHNLIDLVETLIGALLLAVAVEAVTRKIMHTINLRRAKGYNFKNLPIHILQSVLPVIFFGVTAYVAVISWQKGVNDIAFNGFVIITAIIMIRTSWLVLRVLFASRQSGLDQASEQMMTVSYQFLVATFQIIIIGAIFAEIGEKLGVGQLAYQIWMRIIGFGVVSLMIITAWKMRFAMQHSFEYEDDHSRGLTLVMHKIFAAVGRYGYLLITLILCLSYFFLLLGMIDHAWHLFLSLLICLILTSIVLWLRQVILRLSENLHQRLIKDPSQLILTSASQAQALLVNFLQTVMLLVYFMLLFQIWGADPISVITDPYIQPYLTSTVSIIIILVVVRALWTWVDYAARMQMQPKRVGKRNVEPSLFSKTITPILRSIGHWILTIAAVVLIMEEIGIPIMPIIYGISVIGIAISLGAQSLVKDLINGILTLMEGNIAVGESVIIGAHSGVVESLSLRGVSLRHPTGALQTIPFSEVSNIINRSRDYSVVPIELQVPYGTELDYAHGVIQRAYDRMKTDTVYSSMILDNLNVSGMDKFTDVGVSVMASIKIKPDPRNRFARVFNNILRQEIEKAGLLPPHPTSLSLNKELPQGQSDK